MDEISWSLIPPEILSDILKYLGPPDIKSMRLTCNNWKNISSEPIILENIQIWNYEQLRLPGSVFKHNATVEVKIFIFGDAEVGKSALMKRFTLNEFDPNYDHTLGIDYKSFCLKYREIIVKLTLWDHDGHEKTYRPLSSSHLQGPKALIFVFNLAKKSTFEKVDKWLVDVSKYATAEIPKILVGNFVDEAEREVSKETAENYAKSKGMRYFETSAKTGKNVHKAFFTAFFLIAKQYKKQIDKLESNGDSKKNCVMM